MSTRTIQITDELYAYLLDQTVREAPVLARLRAATVGVPGASMQIAPDQGQFLALLVELTGARRVLEVGTFTGYSALAMALALPPDGRVVTCDVNPETTAIAREYWTEGGVGDRIDLRLGPALETLDGLIADGQAGSFDMMFIDANKDGYGDYYERGLALVRPGGLIAVDNALWSGAVADPSRDDPDTAAIRTLNAKVRDDERVTSSLVPIGDGLLLARKRG